MADVEKTEQAGYGYCCNGECKCTKEVRGSECKQTKCTCCADEVSVSTCTNACESAYTCIIGKCQCSTTCECPKCRSCSGGNPTN